MQFRGHDIVTFVELIGVYDGWSVGVTADGTRLNRWANPDGPGAKPGYERRYEVTEAYLRGEEANGRWF